MYKKNILQTIFSDHFEYIHYVLRPGKNVMDNIKRMIHCQDPSYGQAVYGCPHCGKLKSVPFSCKSRFCPSCGNMYNQKRAFRMSCKLISCNHRHCVFTIPEELRIFFLKDHSLLNCLFHAVRDIVLRMFSKLNKTENFTPGFICVLHTFGRDLKWNPHIHCLISEGGIGKSLRWRHKKHFNYKLLRDSFQTALLNELHKRLGDSFKKVKSSIYADHKNGFYVRAMPNKCNPNHVIKYIGRYLGRPVIATSRIDSYDGDSVTFHYNRHEDNKLITETIPALDFISRLTQHIPEKHFKMIRYYGIYARHRESDQRLRRAVSKEKHTIFLSFNRWRESILHSFGYDPLKCHNCGTTMLFLELYFNHKPVPLHELYEKVMRKYRCRSPACVLSHPAFS